MGPVLRKLSKPGLLAEEIASLLEKHISGSRNATHCEQAIAALPRIRDAKIRKATISLARIFRLDEDPCATVRRIVETLRDADWS